MSTDTQNSVIAIRGRYIASRLVQAVGFYLLLAAIIDFFSRPLMAGGIPIGSIPQVLWQPYLSIPVHGVFVMVLGMATIWFSTSPWFLGSIQK